MTEQVIGKAKHTQAQAQPHTLSAGGSESTLSFN